MKCWCGRDGEHERTPVCTPEFVRAVDRVVSEADTAPGQAQSESLKLSDIVSASKPLLDAENRADNRAQAAIEASHADNWEYRQLLERTSRRHALLQAAATIGAAQCNSVSGIQQDGERLVDCAEWLLAEIERREATRAKEGS